MRIIGHGIDLVEISRIEQLIKQHETRFLTRCFTPAEVGYAQNKRRAAEHFAGRFAAKEAILKAPGKGWGGGIAWTDAEVLRLASGAPVVRLHGRCEQVANEMGIGQWWISISHTRLYATASAIGAAIE